jgi:hypothetical protein
MVKDLSRYLGKTINVSYDAEGKEAFKSQLVVETDKYGNKEYYVRTPEGKKRIYANGKKRISMYDGTFLLLDQDRTWLNIVKFMNDQDKEMRA